MGTGRTGIRLAALQGVALVGIFGLSACGGSSSTNGAGTQATTPASPVSVTLVGAPADIGIGEALPVTAQVLGSTSSVTWTVDDIQNGNSDVGTITGSGNSVTYTAPAAEGSHMVAAISVSEPTKSARGQVGIHRSRVSSVVIGPTTWTLNVGIQKQFAATVAGTGTYNSAITWTAKLGTITSSGLYTAPSTSGSDVVTATSVQDPTKIATARVTVTVASSSSSISSVAVSPATLSLNANAQKQFAATLTGTGTYNSEVTWSAQRGSITSAGLYVAPSTGGSDVVTAKSVQDTSKVATASVTVAVASSSSSISSVAVSPTTLSLNVSAQNQFTATVSGSGQYNPTVTWSAQSGSITSTGLYTASATSGTDVVIAKSVQDASKSTTASVTVTGANTAPMEVVGFGKNTTGGANYSEVHVTNLNDSGSGSFRASLGSNRRIVFDVGGTISITSANIDVSNITNLTIDGTNAPSPGITFNQRGIWFRNSSNIIIKNIRHRGGYDAGPETGPNITFFPNCTNVVLDHCSFSGFSDSGINFWSNNHEVTITDCLIGPGTNAGHNFPVLISDKSYNVTMVHTLIYGGDYRNPAAGWADNDNPDYPQAAPAIVADIVNNLIYKYGGYGTSIYWGAKANVRGNFYWSDSGGTAFEVGDPYKLAQAYCDGNYHKDGGSISGNVGSPFSIPTAAQVTATSAATAANYVVANAGCRVGGLDAYDQALINAIVL